MSTAVIFGITGYAGGHIARELVARGYDVIGVARTAPEEPLPGVDFVTGSFHDIELASAQVDRADVVISAVRAATVAQDGASFADAVAALLPAIGQRGARLGIVGGAGSLRFPGSDRLRIEDPALPEAQRPEAREQYAALNMLRDSGNQVDWFYVSPPALFGSYAKGLRTGRYRTGIDELVVAPDGSSTISGEDFALAFVDEIQTPQHHRQRFSVGY
ncbi:NAD(P)-dependent oxidoreductase [Arthrobacter sp. KNU40]|uniref:NAD(P)-dependent oxidoreductase n=1 Tax=Arthrobacter sp. KNU40 TaxID=3447965 RepID=UPI003F612810